MQFAEEVKFFCNMFNVTSNYASQCIRDVSDMIVAMIEHGESVTLPRAMKLYVRPKRTVKNQTRTSETIRQRYELIAHFYPTLIKAAKKETALKRIVITKQIEKEQDKRKRIANEKRKLRRARAKERRRQKLYGRTD